jgi:hypothetical protein
MGSVPEKQSSTSQRERACQYPLANHGGVSVRAYRVENPTAVKRAATIEQSSIKERAEEDKSSILI